MGKADKEPKPNHPARVCWPRSEGAGIQTPSKFSGRQLGQAKGKSQVPVDCICSPFFAWRTINAASVLETNTAPGRSEKTQKFCTKHIEVANENMESDKETLPFDEKLGNSQGDTEWNANKCPYVALCLRCILM